MIITLAGVNSFLVQEKLQHIIDVFMEANGDFGLERLDGETASYEQLVGSLESLPFLSPKKLVILRNPSVNKQFTEKFKSALDRIAEGVDVVIVETKMDKRSVYYKLLKKSSEFVDCSELDARELPNWLVQTAQGQAGYLSINDARYLVDRVGVGQQLLYNEIHKLVEYDPHITRVTIDLMTDRAPQSSVFQLLDATFSGNARRAYELYDEQRSQNVDVHAIMGMLAWQLNILAIVKTAGNKPAANIAKEAKLNPYVVQKTQDISRKLSLTELRALIRQVTDLDEKLKSVAIDADSAMRQLLLDITQLVGN